MEAIQNAPIGMKGKAAMQRPSFSSTFSRYSKKLAAVGIITTVIASSALFPSLAFAKGKKDSKVTAKPVIEETYYRAVSSGTTVVYGGKTYNIRYETRNNNTSLISYVDGEYHFKIDINDEIQNKFSGKFTNREIIIGNPSMMIKGIDGKGNYCCLLFDDMYGPDHSLATAIISDFNAETLKKIGVTEEIRFDEKKKEWKMINRDKRDKIVFFTIYSEDGKKLKEKDCGLYKLMGLE